jgi:hypothetical protein
VRYTPSGVKLLLYSPFNNNSYVYNLPGNLVCETCSEDLPMSINNSSMYDGNVIAFPNPSDNEIKIPNFIFYSIELNIQILWTKLNFCP